MGKKMKSGIEARYYYIAPETSGLYMLGNRKQENYYKKDSLHFHNYLEIGYCYQGQGRIVIREETYQFHKEMFTVIPKDTVHQSLFDEQVQNDWGYIFIDVEENLIRIFGEKNHIVEKVINRIEQNAYLMDTNNQPRVGMMIRYMMDVAREKQEWYLEELRFLTAGLVLELARVEPRERMQVGKVHNFSLDPALDYMNQYYGSTIRTAELAELCHISETHFRRCFRATLHMSPMEYLNWVRIRAACEELKIDRKSIYVIAEQCGFPTISTFNRNFNRLMGCTPREWRDCSVESQNQFHSYFWSQRK